MKVDFLVLGAGIAGLSTVHSLLQHNKKIAVVDTGEIASGASGTPAGMVNPVTGRRAKLCWRPEACYNSITSLITEVEKNTGTIVAARNGVLRPAAMQKMAKKMKSSFQKQQWPDDWVTWLTEHETHQFHKDIRCVDGAIWVKVGMWLDIGRYIRLLSSVLRQRGVSFFTNCSYAISKDVTRWSVTHPDGKIKAHSLVVATGARSHTMEFWNDIPLHPLKGQIAEFEVSKALNFTHAVSSLGYFIPSNSNTLSVGSTYEHSFDHEKTTKKGAQKLKEKALRTFPCLEGELSLKNQWSGVRATTPNKLPIVGRHPEISNLYILTGLGSKGLLYGKYLSELLTSYIMEETPIPKEVSVKRFYD